MMTEDHAGLQPVAAPDFIAAMGQHVSSVCVITTLHQGQRYGLTATAVSSVCAAPPRLLVCVNRQGASHAMIAVSGIFCVNVLEEGHDRIARAFAGKDAERFAAGDWTVISTGAPVLTEAVAAFDCRLAEAFDEFSHTIFIGEVVGVSGGQGRDPLLYGARRFRSLRKAVTSPAAGEMEALHF